MIKLILTALAILGLIIGSYFGYQKWIKSNGTKANLIPKSADQNKNIQIQNVEVNAADAEPPQVSLTVSGNFPNTCTKIEKFDQRLNGKTFFVSISTKSTSEICSQVTVPFRQNISLNVRGATSGNFKVDVNGQVKSFTIP